jgi:hypothetical protein
MFCASASKPNHQSSHQKDIKAVFMPPLDQSNPRFASERAAERLHRRPRRQCHLLHQQGI